MYGVLIMVDDYYIPYFVFMMFIVNNVYMLKFTYMTSERPLPLGGRFMMKIILNLFIAQNCLVIFMFATLFSFIFLISIMGIIVFLQLLFMLLLYYFHRIKLMSNGVFPWMILQMIVILFIEGKADLFVS